MTKPLPWYRMYHEMIDDPKVQHLPDGLFKVWINLLGLTRRSGDHLESVSAMAWALRLDEAKMQRALTMLMERGLIDREGDGYIPHNWHARQYKSDDSTTRVREWRERQRESNPPKKIGRPRKGENPATLHETLDVTRRNEKSETLHVTLDETPTDTDTDTENREQREEQSIPSVSLTLAPNGAKMTTQQSVIAALMIANGSDPHATLTKGEASRYGKAAAEIVAAGGVAADVALRASNYATRFPDAPCTPSALAAHWGECATAPAAKRAKFVTKGEAVEQRTMQGIEDFRRMRKGSSDEPSTLRAGDDRTGGSVRSGRERPASERLLRPPAKPSR